MALKRNRNKGNADNGHNEMQLNQVERGLKNRAESILSRLFDDGRALKYFI